MTHDVPRPDQPSLDPDELAICLKVLAASQALPPEHPDALAIRRATARVFKQVKRARRVERRDAITAADLAVVAATATGSPQRIDDETEGLPLVSSALGASAGTLQRPRPCYICKQDYTRVDAFYHQLCPSCAATSHAKRDARTDLTGRRALLTGGRAKIGMYIALRLLREVGTKRSDWAALRARSAVRYRCKSHRAGLQNLSRKSVSRRATGGRFCAHRATGSRRLDTKRRHRKNFGRSFLEHAGGDRTTPERAVAF